MCNYPNLGYKSRYPIKGFVIHDRYCEEELALRNFLRDRRKNAGLRQADLAERLGVPQSFVSKYESGERLLTFTETFTILRELGIDVRDVMDRLEKITNETES